MSKLKMFCISGAVMALVVSCPPAMAQGYNGYGCYKRPHKASYGCGYTGYVDGPVYDGYERVYGGYGPAYGWYGFRGPHHAIYGGYPYGF